MGAENFGPVDTFLKDQHTPLFLAAVAGASIFNGMFVVPLQAMAQRRAHPRIRAQLMSAGSVLYNFAVNALTFGLIGLAILAMPPKAPFMMIVIGSALVSVYAITLRVFRLDFAAVFNAGLTVCAALSSGYDSIPNSTHMWHFSGYGFDGRAGICPIRTQIGRDPWGLVRLYARVRRGADLLRSIRSSSQVANIRKSW
jgi:hypothetical protein